MPPNPSELLSSERMRTSCAWSRAALRPRALRHRADARRHRRASLLGAHVRRRRALPLRRLRAPRRTPSACRDRLAHGRRQAPRRGAQPLPRGSTGATGAATRATSLPRRLRGRGPGKARGRRRRGAPGSRPCDRPARPLSCRASTTDRRRSTRRSPCAGWRPADGCVALVATPHQRRDEWPEPTTRRIARSAVRGAPAARGRTPRLYAGRRGAGRLRPDGAISIARPGGVRDARRVALPAARARPRGASAPTRSSWSTSWRCAGWRADRRAPRADPVPRLRAGSARPRWSRPAPCCRSPR